MRTFYRGTERQYREALNLAEALGIKVGGV
jgi:hypothetical protein